MSFESFDRPGCFVTAVTAMDAEHAADAAILSCAVDGPSAKAAASFEVCSLAPPSMQVGLPRE